jgi:hypothetical protein
MSYRLVKTKASELELHRKSKAERKVSTGVRSLQALVRGTRARQMMGSMYDQRENAVHCVECEYKVAVKRCRECNDCFCFLCFENLHGKGNRALHRSELIVDEPVPQHRHRSRSVSMSSLEFEGENSSVEYENYQQDDYQLSASETPSPVPRSIGFNQPYDESGSLVDGYSESYIADYDANVKYSYATEWGGDPSECWVEYFDDGAQAKYWFNTATSEATWLSPFEEQPE